MNKKCAALMECKTTARSGQPGCCLGVRVPNSAVRSCSTLVLQYSTEQPGMWLAAYPSVYADCSFTKICKKSQRWHDSRNLIRPCILESHTITPVKRLKQLSGDFLLPIDNELWRTMTVNLFQIWLRVMLSDCLMMCSSLKIIKLTQICWIIYI